MEQYDNITDLGLSFGDGNDNPSGVGEIAFFIPFSWMKTVAKPADATTAGSLITITGNHMMIAGKAPIKVNTLFDKSGINWKLAGEKLSKIFEIGAELFVPDNSVKSLGSAAALKTYRGILLIGKIDGSGHFWQVGSELIAATIVDIAGGTGVGPTGEVGSKITVQSYASVPVYSYEGAVPPVGAA
ncbi:hypothetical protein [Pedobacter antarcticus]|uniref:hypothetical protein n=1 Tax=Pedobacter antarcticus TaxID=34086 RepID=UPI00292DC13E|nr:hypothetical protein [Pedobacter antarcticus]